MPKKQIWELCSLPDCVELAHGQGMCRRHYMAHYRAATKAGTYEKTQRRDYQPIDVDDLWEFCKRELNLI